MNYLTVIQMVYPSKHLKEKNENIKMYENKAMDFMLVFIIKRRLIDKPIKKIINKETDITQQNATKMSLVPMEIFKS